MKPISKEQMEEFEKLARPLIEWLNNNYHPHVEATITPVSAEISEGIVFIPVKDYIKD